jgi:hypothetical protein
MPRREELLCPLTKGAVAVDQGVVEVEQDDSCHHVIFAEFSPPSSTPCVSAGAVA